MTELSRLEPKVKLPKIKQTEKKTTRSKPILQYLLTNKTSDYIMSKDVRKVKVVFQRKTQILIKWLTLIHNTLWPRVYNQRNAIDAARTMIKCMILFIFQNTSSSPQKSSTNTASKSSSSASRKNRFSSLLQIQNVIIQHTWVCESITLTSCLLRL